MSTQTQLQLFGGEKGWETDDWVACDDRIRGGRSRSYLKISDRAATFCGNLDFDTLGGAGFASQQTTGDDRHWDLSRYNGIEILIDVTKSDRKRYTFIIKDKIPTRDRQSGGEQSTLSWEYDFEIKDEASQGAPDPLVTITIPWKGLTPTYRGRVQQPEHSLRPAKIRRMSLMMRSFFGTQQGDFALCVVGITATGASEPSRTTNCTTASSLSDSSSFRNPKSIQTPPSEDQPKSFWTRLLSVCNKL